MEPIFKRLFIFTAAILLASNSPAAIRYVNINNQTPAPPYATWAAAATNIQDAVDVADPGDHVLVTNGVYHAGVSVLYGVVSATNAITVESVGGPGGTLIDGNDEMACVYLANGALLSGFTVTNGRPGVIGESISAVVSNCVIIGNHAQYGGGASSGTYNDCTFSGNAAEEEGGAARGATLNSCTLIGNSAGYGGGASYSTLSNCTLIGNTAVGSGGGAKDCTLDHCTFSNNWAGFDGGGGAFASVLTRCTLNSNSTTSGGGGARDCALDGCIVKNNSAVSGGGILHGSAKNCAFTGNYASDTGGGAAKVGFLTSCILTNCTLTGNSASGGGGADECTLINCILYFNEAPLEANYSGGSLDHCCTVPNPFDGAGNFTADPQMADSYHLSANSPCRGAGIPGVGTGTDIDGEAWLNPRSVGCDEFHAGTITGPLSVAILAENTNVAAGFGTYFTTQIEGHASSNRWDFGDGTKLGGKLNAVHSWPAPGNYEVVFSAFNESHPGGVSATSIVHVVPQPVHYVNPNNAAPVAPYSSWATAATNIQDAVDAASVSGALILVTNGVFETGGQLVGSDPTTNRVAISKPVTVQSINGPEVTWIVGRTPMGDNAVRAAYLTRGAALTGFTLTNGSVSLAGTAHQQAGAGAWCEDASAVISNCVLIGNIAPGFGGGAYGGTLNNCIVSANGASAGNGRGGGACGTALSNCIVSGNSASRGGGVFSGTLVFCTLTNNLASFGGGARDCLLDNCLVISNRAFSAGGGVYQGVLNNCVITRNGSGEGGGGVGGGGSLTNCTLANNRHGGADGCELYNCIVWNNSDVYDFSTYFHCCTEQIPLLGSGNFTNAPLFVNQPDADLHLQSNSPCINSGNNADAPAGFDLDGLPRIVGGTVDVGAYEFQSPASILSYAWLEQYGLANDGSADYSDTDGDRHNNWQEWRAHTVPTDVSSVLKMLTPSNTVASVTVSWQSVSGVNYFLQRSSNLGSQPAFLTIVSNITGQAGFTSYTDTNAVGSSQSFYRVGVQ